MMTVMEMMTIAELLAPMPLVRQDTAEALRAVVFRVVPDAQEAVRVGWRLIGYRAPIGRKSVYFGWIYPQVEHVHLGFEYGAFMEDPESRLEGKGITRQVRWVTFDRPDDVDAPALEPMLREAIRVAAMTRGERFARILDRDEEDARLRIG
jgi:hypothetical protein